MDEHSFIRSVHRHLPNRVYRWKINARFTKGVPDAWYSGDKGDLWIEYKWLARTPKRRAQLGLTALQRKWLNDRYDEGRSVAVVVGCPQGALLLTDKNWNEPLEAGVYTWQSTQIIGHQILQIVDLRSDTGL